MLMRSVSGIRGIVGADLTPEVVTRSAAGFGTALKGGRVVVARDTRPTGPFIAEAAISGLLSVGCDVIDIGIAPTPTVPLAVTHLKAAGGMAITASHNPIEWNALKFLGSSRKLLSPAMIDGIYRLADAGPIKYQAWDKIGQRSYNDDMIDMHIARILRLAPVDARAIARRKLKVAYDAGGGAGARYCTALLRRLGCRVHEIHCTVGKRFPRGPEPVPGNLKDLCAAVRRFKADIGFATDPDSDRLAIVDERGRPIGEERTLALATYWVMMRTPGPVVINLSTSRAVLDIARAFGQRGYTSKVGEANVAEMMRGKRAVIGGEGNGGVIMPELHYGRDALLGIALVLSLVANQWDCVSDISQALPTYFAAKTKIPRPNDLPRRLKLLATYYIKGRVDDRDGIKIEFDDGSIHARPSNTEPIMRISAEARTQKRAKGLLAEAMKVMKV
ncbi:MAG: phosphoglucosamine mutase [candidate division Zixibacteria bacterium]|nr:phosphoglucosamine mutase [candidate division Zixibacteria bacterium]